MAFSTLVNLNSSYTAGFNLQTQGNGAGKVAPAMATLGDRYSGDHNSNLIVAVTSFGIDDLCRGTDYSYRIDQVDVLLWLAEHMYTP